MRHLIKISLLSFKNRINSLKFRDDFKAAVFIFIGINLGIVIYGASYAFLKYLNSVAVVGPLIVNKLLALIFITAFAMTVLSSIIVSFSSLYFGKDIKWLMVSPIKIESIFLFKSAGASFYASWMIFAALVPFVAALGNIKNASPSFYIFSALCALPFLACAGFTGTGFTVIVMRFFPAAKIRNLILVIGALFFTFVLVFIRFIQPEKFISSQGFELLSQYLGYLDAPTAKFLPSWWYTSVLTGLIAGDIKRVFFSYVLLFAAAFLLFYLIKSAAEKYYFEGLNKGQVFAPAVIRKQTFFKRNSFLSVFMKDMKVFVRDSNQWSQVLILASIVVVYLFSMYKLSFETMKMHNVMSLANCAIVWFVAAAVSLRLSFPLISIEGESFWFLLTSPLGKLKLFLEKMLFGALPVFVVSIILISATNYMMHISKPVFILTAVATAAISLLISCAGVSIGTLFPKFNYSNIPQIESSLGGLVFMLFSVLMICINLVIIAQPVRMFYFNRLGNGGFLEFGTAIILIDALFFVIISFVGYNALKRIER